MKYAIYEYECKKDMKSEYKSMCNVFGVELFNQNSMSAKCSCCGKRENRHRTTKNFTYLRKVSLVHLKKCHSALGR